MSRERSRWYVLVRGLTSKHAVQHAWALGPPFDQLRTVCGVIDREGSGLRRLEAAYPQHLAPSVRRCRRCWP